MRRRDTFYKNYLDLYKNLSKDKYNDLYDFLHNFSIKDNGKFSFINVKKIYQNNINISDEDKLHILLSYINLIRILNINVNKTHIINYLLLNKIQSIDDYIYELIDNNNDINNISQKLFTIYYNYYNTHMHYDKYLYHKYICNDTFINNSPYILQKKDIKCDNINIITASGIGDTLWLLVKLSNFKQYTQVKKITLKILMRNEMEARAVKILQNFNFIDNIIPLKTNVYDHLINNILSGEHIYVNNSIIDENMLFLANGHLESGCHLDNIIDIQSDYNFFDKFNWDENINNEIINKYKGIGNILHLSINGYIIIYVAHISYTLDNDKIWENEYFPKLIDYICDCTSVPIYLVGSSWDISMGKKIMDNIVNKNKIKNIIGLTDSIELIYLLKNASFVIGAISGLTITSVYLKTKTIALWASENVSITNDGFRFNNDFSTNWIPKEYIDIIYTPGFYDIDDYSTIYTKFVKLLLK